jgi:cytochrome oxidase Cu insertion factor (SCO1/SenC/PrrC family)
LRNQRDEIVSTHGLDGKVVIFTFLDSACKDSCPIIAGAIGGAIDRLLPAERKQVAALGLTVNPATDVRIFDRNGIWVTTQRLGVDLTPANLAHDIRVALRRHNE